jgi:hypothetical protein
MESITSRGGGWHLNFSDTHGPSCNTNNEIYQPCRSVSARGQSINFITIISLGQQQPVHIKTQNNSVTCRLHCVIRLLVTDNDVPKSPPHDGGEMFLPNVRS